MDHSRAATTSWNHVVQPRNALGVKSGKPIKIRFKIEFDDKPCGSATSGLKGLHKCKPSTDAPSDACIHVVPAQTPIGLSLPTLVAQSMFAWFPNFRMRYLVLPIECKAVPRKYVWEARLTFGVGVGGVGACLESSRGQDPQRSSGAATLGPNNNVIYDRETQIHSTRFHIAPPHSLNQVRMLVLVLSSPPEMMSWWLPSCQHPPALELNIA